MNPPEPEPKPKRSRRMIVWLVVAPIVILLLALAGANWKTFHRAYYKRKLRHRRSNDLLAFIDVEKLAKFHLREGMTEHEVRELFEPIKLRAARYADPTLTELSSPEYQLNFMFKNGRLCQWSYQTIEGD